MLSVSLNLINLFGIIERILTVPYGSETLFFVCSIQKYFFTIQKGNLRHIAISWQFKWSRNIIF